MTIPNHTPKYIPGDHLVTCQRTGRTIRASEARREWTGLIVHESVWEPRHPQDFVVAPREEIAAPFPRTGRRMPLCVPIYEGDVFEPLIYLECV